VVTLEDYEQRERDLNNDARCGYPPGTTERRRREREARAAEQERRLKEYTDRGIPYGVAWNMVYLNQNEKQAREYEERWQKKQSRQRTYSSRWTNRDQRSWESGQRRESLRQSSDWQSGRSAGDRVGLDTQVGGDKRQGRLK
jgi:hypothetical protein